jgi:hypothetical protein
MRGGGRGTPSASVVPIEIRMGQAPDVVRYSLRTPSEVRAGLYDVSGRQIAVLDQSYKGAGAHELRWNLGGLAQGIYFVRISDGTSTVSKSVVVAR